VVVAEVQVVEVEMDIRHFPVAIMLTAETVDRVSLGRLLAHTTAAAGVVAQHQTAILTVQNQTLTAEQMALGQMLSAMERAVVQSSRM
jgi:hypothetical protein